MNACVVTIYLKDKSVKKYLVHSSAAQVSSTLSHTLGHFENIRVDNVIQKDMPSLVAQLLNMKSKEMF